MKKQVILKNLKSFRQQSGLSQVEVSAALGMDRSGYGKIEKGHTDITLERAQEIAKIFGVTVNDLLSPEAGHIRLPIVEESPTSYNVETAKIRIEIGVDCPGNSPEADRFLKRLGELLMSTEGSAYLDKDPNEPGQ